MGNTQRKLSTSTTSNPKVGGGNSSSFTCEICREVVSFKNKYKNKKRCSHPFCSVCIIKYIQLKLEANICAEIKCPDLSCKKLLDPLSCQSLLPLSLFNKWQRRCKFLKSRCRWGQIDRRWPWVKRREKLMVMEIVKKKKWMRCPNCKFIIEKSVGCLHITCRCGTEFCYDCGAKWSGSHRECRADISNNNPDRVASKRKWIATMALARRWKERRG